MTFPWVLSLGGISVSGHALFEAAAYLVGLGFLLRRRSGDAQQAHFGGLALAALLGALLGSKLLAALHHAPTWLSALDEQRLTGLFMALNGKTIVGGLLGGWLLVAAYKRRRGITRRTGDPLVPALIVGTAIGRLGCFVAGLEDATCGLPTTLPWGIDFGDGPRHPTQLYEITFLGLLGAVLWRGAALQGAAPGMRFQVFLAAYLAFRFVVDFLKPAPWHVLGLSVIQWVAAFGWGVCLAQLLEIARVASLQSQPSALTSQQKPGS